MLDGIYDSWGYDEEPRGMETLVGQGVIGFTEPLKKDITVTQVESFVNEEGFVNTDLRQGKCACNN